MENPSKSEVELSTVDNDKVEVDIGAEKRIMSTQDIIKAFTERMNQQELPLYKFHYFEDCIRCNLDVKSDELAMSEKIPAERLYFSIADVARIAKLETSEVLRRAGIGDVEICFPPPADVTICTCYNDKIGPQIIRPELFVLATADCRAIELGSQTQQSSFKVGYVFANAETIRVLPGFEGSAFGNENLAHEDARWITFVGNQLTGICINQAQLFVTRLSLCKFLKKCMFKIESPNLKNSASVVPRDFVNAFDKLLSEIETRMEKAGVTLDKNNMLGTRSDLQYIANKLNPTSLMKADQTFKDYIEGMCKFKAGRPLKGALNPYLEFFPEYIEKKNSPVN